MTHAQPEQVALRDLDVNPDADLLACLYRDVLAVSFSPDELVPVEDLERDLRGEGDAEVLVSVAVDAERAVLGGVVGEIYAPDGVLLLAYLAVRPDVRDRGLGTRLMEHVAPSWYARPGVRLALAEVHDPRLWHDAKGEHASARLRLFRRLGARVLGVPFVQPALGPGRDRVPGFLLLAFHVDRDVELEGGVIPSGLVSSFLRHYYETVEGARPPYDPQLAALLEQVEREDTIDLLPVEEYERVPFLA